MIYERLYVVAIVTAAAMAAAWLISDRMDPIYRAQARCFMPTKADVLSLTTEEGNLPDGPKIPTAVEEVQNSLLGVLRGGDLRQLVAVAVPERTSLQLEKNVDFAIDKYNLITISVYDLQAEVAQRIAQEYVKAFRDYLDEKTKVGIRDNAELLAAAIEVSAADVQRIERERQEFLRGQGTVDYGTQFELVAGKVKSYTQRLDELDARLVSLNQGMQEMLRQRDARPAATDPEAFVPRGLSTVANPELDALNQSLRTARLDFERLLTQYKEGPREVPLLIAKREEIRILQEAIQAEEERIRGAEDFGPDPLRERLDLSVVEQQTQVSATEAERQEYARLLATAQQEFQKLPEYALKLEDYAAELANSKETLANQRSRLAELDLYLRRTSSFLAVAEDPALPIQPWFPQMTIVLIAAAILGLTVAVLAVVVMAQVARFREEALW